MKAVYISEVAWMGSVESANYEWIELHNDGAAQPVDGWILTDGANLNIELSGTIPSGSYAVLERTSDASAAGTAFLVYTGALVNTGATLKLLDANGAMVDQVAGGTDWSNIGGDNVTKETAQYSPSGWITADATPGSSAPANVPTENEIDTNPESDEPSHETASDKKSKSSGKKSGADEAIQLVLPDVTLKLEIDAQAVGYVNQPIDFMVEPSGIGPRLIDSLRYEWNFGDTETATGQTPQHVYHFPGTYVVTVFGEFKRQHQVAQHHITILPVALSLTQNQHGDIQINNDARYDIDVSEYRLVGHDEVVFPPRSVLLAGQTVTIPEFRVKDSGEAMVALYDAAGMMVASRLPQGIATQSFTEEMTENPSTVAYEPAPQPRISALATSRDYPKMTEAIEPVAETKPASLGFVESEKLVATAGDAELPRSERFTYVLLAITLLLAVFGVYLAPKRNDS